MDHPENEGRPVSRCNLSHEDEAKSPNDVKEEEEDLLQVLAEESDMKYVSTERASEIPGDYYDDDAHDIHFRKESRVHKTIIMMRGWPRVPAKLGTHLHLPVSFLSPTKREKMSIPPLEGMIPCSCHTFPEFQDNYPFIRLGSPLCS